jgi:hypothetical protein
MVRRFIKRGQRSRIVLRGSSQKDFCSTCAHLQDVLGFEEIGIIGFVLHLLLWWTKKNAVAKEG